MYVEGYRNLTEEYLKGFNPNNPDHPDVDYYSVVCSKEMTPLDIFYVPYSYIKAVEGIISSKLKKTINLI